MVEVVAHTAGLGSHLTYRVHVPASEDRENQVVPPYIALPDPNNTYVHYYPRVSHPSSELEAGLQPTHLRDQMRPFYSVQLMDGAGTLASQPNALVPGRYRRRRLVPTPEFVSQLLPSHALLIMRGLVANLTLRVSSSLSLNVYHPLFHPTSSTSPRR